MGKRLVYNENWQREYTLDDGTRVRYRLLKPSDREKLKATFDRLSPKSRYQRFLVQKNGLTDEELNFFTQCDGIDHLAVAATTLDENGKEQEAIGDARFVRIVDEPDAAEIAVTVVDDWHRRGFGKHLLRHIMAAMAERGIRRMRGVMQADNGPMRHLLEKYVPAEAFLAEGPLVVFEAPVPNVVPEALEEFIRDPSLSRLLRLARLGHAVLPLRSGLKIVEDTLEDTVLPAVKRWQEKLDDVS